MWWMDAKTDLQTHHYQVKHHNFVVMSSLAMYYFKLLCIVFFHSVVHINGGAKGQFYDWHLILPLEEKVFDLMCTPHC